ncbi:MAG TPA: hypothetical protein VGW74_11800, partial [Propionibacteriaceae bacterium]|nr:hypothetical protein [Propionibacteriaceae bacterium]
MTLVEFVRARMGERKQQAKAALLTLPPGLPEVVLADIAVKQEILRCYEEMVERREHFRELGFKTGATEAALESY